MSGTQIHYTYEQVEKYHKHLLSEQVRTKELITLIERLAKQYYDVPIKGWVFTKQRRDRVLTPGWDSEPLCFCSIVYDGILEQWWSLLNTRFDMLNQYVADPKSTGVSLDDRSHQVLVKRVDTLNYWTDKRIQEAIQRLSNFDIKSGVFLE